MAWHDMSCETSRDLLTQGSIGWNASKNGHPEDVLASHLLSAESVESDDIHGTTAHRPRTCKGASMKIELEINSCICGTALDRPLCSKQVTS
jgi:hypothetical protein